tara:strand:- start:1718 stop:1936 length:219 start_codon:yes stop_codon:yes gene_type:complete
MGKKIIMEFLKNFRNRNLKNKYLDNSTYIYAVDVESILIDIKHSTISDLDNKINNYLLKIEDLIEENKNGVR